MKTKILICFGTRPEAIKMAPVIRAFKKNNYFETKVCVTAQHREMLDQVLEFFQITPDVDLNLMQANQSLNDLSSNIIASIDKVLAKLNPDYVLVHGDTTTSSMVALTAFHRGIKIGHVEAGLRTYNKSSPFPEEINRQLTARIADIHFAPTKTAYQNLINEGIKKENILITGNTVVDALHLGIKLIEKQKPKDFTLLKSKLNDSKKLILVTGHRRENFSEGILNLCLALVKISERGDVNILYPVHLNPKVQSIVNERLSNYKNIHLIAPVNYPVMLCLMQRCDLIISDSGGIQEEAASLGKMVLVTRENTERNEGIKAGYAELVSTQIENIVSRANYYLDNDIKLNHIKNPYGDGNASKMIVKYLNSI